MGSSASDELASDPPHTSCAGCVSAQSEIRALLDHISSSFSANPSKFLGFQLPSSRRLGDAAELYRRWAKKFDAEAEADTRFPLCPDLKKRIKALVFRLLREGYERVGVKRKRAAFADVLELLRSAAVDPTVGVGGDEWKAKVLKAREVLFVRLADATEHAELACLKKQNSRKYLRAVNDGSGNHMFNEPIRRSKRTLLKIGNSELPRKHIPIGEFFQADVPDWTGPQNKEDMLDDVNELNNSRWLGTQIWPIEAESGQISDKMIGKGRSDSCTCPSYGSIECARFHVNNARLQLKSELGPAFFNLGFAEMGEEVSKSWTQEEQMKFDDLVRQNPSSEGMSFWEPVLKYFSSKRRQDIVSFYFNVFVLRWMSIRTRMGALTVDSSDDENMGWG